MISKITLRSLIISAVLILFLLAACSPPSTPTATVEVTSTQAPEAVATPTATPEPAVVWLVAGPDVDPNLYERVLFWMTGQSKDDNFSLEVKDSISPAEAPANLQAVIFLSPTENIQDIAASLPQTRFVALTDKDLSPGANLSIIKTLDIQAAFLAGYLATLNAPDFRSGALFVDGRPNTANLQDAFLNGGRYFCGRCAPVYAPIVLFPQVGLVPAGADAAGWKAAFDILNQNDIEMLYVPIEGLLPDFLAYLTEKNVKIITPIPPPDNFVSIFVANVESASLTALVELWPQLASLTEGKLINAGVQITHLIPENLSAGRRQLAERIIPDLISGVISPLSVP
jgi:hypothetical protein